MKVARLLFTVLLAAAHSAIDGRPSGMALTAALPPTPCRSYLGESGPGPSPALFAPGVVSTGLAERDVAIPPDGREFYFSAAFRTVTAIMVSRQVGTRWTAPEVAPFATDPAYFHMEPSLSADGRRVFFLTNRPASGEPRKAGWASQRIWAADRTETAGWGQPYDLGPPINVDGANYFPSVAANGTLYFTRARAGSRDVAIYRARPSGNGFAVPERLPESVNGYGGTFNGFVAPDESYLIAGVEGREDSVPPKAANYYIFFRRADGSWTSGTNMGAAVNMAGNTTHSAFVSPDGCYLFLASNALREPPKESLRGLRLEQLAEFSTRPQNGNSDIYWVNAAFIDALRSAALERCASGCSSTPGVE